MKLLNCFKKKNKVYVQLINGVSLWSVDRLTNLTSPNKLEFSKGDLVKCHTKQGKEMFFDKNLVNPLVGRIHAMYDSENKYNTVGIIITAINIISIIVGLVLMYKMIYGFMIGFGLITLEYSMYYHLNMKFNKKYEFGFYFIQGFIITCYAGIILINVLK